MERKDKSLNLENSIVGTQILLAQKALKDKIHQFDNLFGLITKEDWLEIATKKFLGNNNIYQKIDFSANMGDQKGESKELTGEEVELVAKLSAQLQSNSYQPQPVTRVDVSKFNGYHQVLGIPSVEDGIVLEAINMVLEPIMESHFLNASYCRPSMKIMDCIQSIAELTSNENYKYWWAIEGQLERCFQEIPHRNLMGVLRKYLKDKKLLKLIKSFLNAGIIFNSKVAKPNCGVIQAGNLSSLLVNVYLHELDLFWWNKYGILTEYQKNQRRLEGLGNVKYLRYLDGFVLLTDGDKEFAGLLRLEIEEKLGELGLKLSNEKGKITHLNDGIEFLGFEIQRKHSQAQNKSIVQIIPSKINISKFKDKIRELTSFKQVNNDVGKQIQAINQIVAKWAKFYRYVNSSSLFRELGHWINERVYLWLRKKHSNLSSKMSIKKYVMKTYKIRTDKGNYTWGKDGVKLIPMWRYKIKKYSIKEKRINPYLNF